MKIQTEQDMIDFCEEVSKNNQNRQSFKVDSKSNSSLIKEFKWDSLNLQMIEKGNIAKGSHLQKGILDIYNYSDGHVHFTEIPFIYPSGKVLENYRTLTGPISGVLVNCYDPQTKDFLFHMRGNDIASPFGFQAAAAGMGIYGQQLALTAGLELLEEAGLEKFRQLYSGNAIDVLPFMKGGPSGIPQLLFGFGFSDDLSMFPSCPNLEEIAEFESQTKEEIKNGSIRNKEGYHFTIPYRSVEKVAGEINDSGRFFGPIYDSTINFIRSLKDNHYLD